MLSRSVLLFSALCCAVSLGQDGGNDARLLVSKFILSGYAVENKEFAVDYNIYNVGDKPALQVNLTDDYGFSQEYFDIERGMLKVRELCLRFAIT